LNKLFYSIDFDRCMVLENSSLIIVSMHMEFFNKAIICASSEIIVGCIVFLIKVYLSLRVVVSQM
jgi:hypothetical protein